MVLISLRRKPRPLPDRPSRRRSRRGPAPRTAAPGRPAAPGRGPRRLRCAEWCGDQQLGAVGDVLVLVAVELLARDDLAGHRRLRLEVAEHGHLDLAADDRFLDHDRLVVPSAVAIASRSSSTVWALETPTDEPMLAGLTKAGSPRSAATRRAARASARAHRSCGTGPAGCRRPAATCLAIALSIATADPSTPLPT